MNFKRIIDLIILISISYMMTMAFIIFLCGPQQVGQFIVIAFFTVFGVFLAILPFKNLRLIEKEFELLAKPVVRPICILVVGMCYFPGIKSYLWHDWKNVMLYIGSIVVILTSLIAIVLECLKKPAPVNLDERPAFEQPTVVMQQVEQQASWQMNYQPIPNPGLIQTGQITQADYQ